MLLVELIDTMDRENTNIDLAITTRFPVGTLDRKVVDFPITEWADFYRAYNMALDAMTVESLEVFHPFGQGKKIHFGIICDYESVCEEEVEFFFADHGEDAI